MKKNYLSTLIFSFCLATLLGSATAIAQDSSDEAEKKTTFNYGGYVKLDAIQTWYNHGEVSSTSPIRDFILPSQIPVGGSYGTQTMDFHVKESRFNFDVTTVINNNKIHGFLELDFLLSGAGDEKVSNSFNPRLRHFFLEWHRFTIGQTWSTFMVVVVPDDMDFAGAMEGLVFVRQPQIRYRYKTWSFAVENPESIALPYNSETQVISEKEIMPDLVVRKDFKGDWGTWAITGMYRTLAFNDTTTKYTAPGFGISTGGKLNVGNRGNDLRLVVSGGTGIGRYAAANFLPGGYLDANSNLNTIPTVNGFVAYNQYWIPHILSSSFNVGYYQNLVDKNRLITNVNQAAMSASANIKYDPVPELRFGLEFSWAQRILMDDTSGDLYRIQFSAKYRFGYTDSKTIEK